MIERAELCVHRKSTLKAGVMPWSSSGKGGSKRAMSPHSSGRPAQQVSVRNPSRRRRPATRTAWTICRPCRVDWVRPARSSAERWNDSVEEGTPRRAPISPAGRPLAPSAMSRRIRSSRVSWERAPNATAASEDSMILELQNSTAAATRERGTQPPPLHPDPLDLIEADCVVLTVVDRGATATHSGQIRLGVPLDLPMRERPIMIREIHGSLS